MKFTTRTLYLQKTILILMIIGTLWCLFPSLSYAQSFISPVNNPFGLVSATTNTSGRTANVVLADLDGDGDLDALAGNTDVKNGLFVGEYDYYENIGSPSVPQFAAPVIDPFGLIPIMGPRPTLGDLDGDGDLDLMVGEDFGELYFLENTGTSTAPQFAMPILNPFGLNPSGNLWTPEFVDIDSDGDLDLLTLNFNGEFSYYENTGTPTSPQYGTPQSASFGLTDFSGADTAYPDFADLDGDGDLDLLVIGNFFPINKIQYFENTGTAAAPQFIAPVGNPFGLSDAGINTGYPAFADLDNDGDIDLMDGAEQGDFLYFENTLISSSEEVDELISIELYPNPTSGMILIDTRVPIKELAFFNALGQLEMSIEPKGNRINVAHLPKGSYFVRLLDNNGQRATRKLLIY